MCSTSVVCTESYFVLKVTLYVRLMHVNLTHAPNTSLIKKMETNSSEKNSRYQPSKVHYWWSAVKMDGSHSTVYMVWIEGAEFWHAKDLSYNWSSLSFVASRIAWGRCMFEWWNMVYVAGFMQLIFLKIQNNARLIDRWIFHKPSSWMFETNQHEKSVSDECTGTLFLLKLYVSRRGPCMTSKRFSHSVQKPISS